MVYSFSKPKRFQLKLYKDKQPDPLIFDKPGVVALGCNIHDWMVGYIYVAESAHFRRSNKEGIAAFDIDTAKLDGPIEVSIWHPRFKATDQQRKLRIDSNQRAISFQLKSPPYPQLKHEADEYDQY